MIKSVTKSLDLLTTVVLRGCACVYTLETQKEEEEEEEAAAVVQCVSQRGPKKSDVCVDYLKVWRLV